MRKPRLGRHRLGEGLYLAIKGHGGLPDSPAGPHKGPSPASQTIPTLCVPFPWTLGPGRSPSDSQRRRSAAGNPGCATRLPQEPAAHRKARSVAAARGHPHGSHNHGELRPLAPSTSPPPARAPSQSATGANTGVVPPRPGARSGSAAGSGSYGQQPGNGPRPVLISGSRGRVTFPSQDAPGGVWRQLVATPAGEGLLASGVETRELVSRAGSHPPFGSQRWARQTCFKSICAGRSWVF